MSPMEKLQKESQKLNEKTLTLLSQEDQDILGNLDKYEVVENE